MDQSDQLSSINMANRQVRLILFIIVGTFSEKFNIPSAYDVFYAWRMFFELGRVGGVNSNHPNSFPSTPPPHLTFKPPQNIHIQRTPLCIL